MLFWVIIADAPVPASIDKFKSSEIWTVLSLGSTCKLKIKPSIAYIDGIFAPKNINIKYKTFIKGDEKIPCIAAASIIAKTSRDLFMIRLGKQFPEYKWEKNFGYGTKYHLLGLKKYGVTKYHRKKFKPVHNILMYRTRETL